MPLIGRLDEKLRGHLQELEQTEVYQIIFRHDTSLKASVLAARHVLVESYYWVPLAIESIFASIGRMPHSRPDLVRESLELVSDELLHPGIALRDFVALGGDEQWVRSRRMTPEAYNIASLCQMLAERESPFAFLGHFHFAESLTPILTQRAQEILYAKGFPAKGRQFIDLHAVEDVKHAQQTRELIEKVVRDFPEAEPAIEYAFDCFGALYPVALWKGVYRNIRGELAKLGEGVQA
jgi:hypothetical protein